MTALPRTPDEIIARIEEVRGHDFFGAEIGSLLDGLTFAQARPLLKDDATDEGWDADGTAEHVEAAAKKYMGFAREKAEDHRGLSADRSIDHFRGWVWLLGFDDEIDWDAYPNYGAPILKQISEHLDIEWPSEGSILDRMARGEECRLDGCRDGCGV